MDVRIISSILFILVCISLFVLQYNYEMDMQNEARAFCDSVKPTWASIVTEGGSLYCVFESGADFREVGYRKETYYLIDGNRLGRLIE